MRTSGPKPGQLAAMVIFTFSCFGLLLFLWLSFGGAIPLKPKGYRFEVAFPEATTLAEQADVRIAGVSVGKVVHKVRDPRGNRTLATIELERRYAPIHRDARAMLRQKTLLGETYVALTPGSRGAPQVGEGQKLPDAGVDDTVELDEVLKIFPKETRTSTTRSATSPASRRAAPGCSRCWTAGARRCARSCARPGRSSRR
jgi:ABC-type transporter Mla subunit MlaD